MITKSSNFIKMCEKNEDLQKAWKPKIGDYVSIIDFSLDGIYIISKMQSDEKSKMYRLDDINNFSSLFEMENILHKKFIYLPTQEQLQEMVLPIFLKRYSTTHALRHDSSFIYRMIIEKFQRWINRSSPSLDKYMAMFSSMNELWLAFVMKEKYNKVWTGEKWVKAKG